MTVNEEEEKKGRNQGKNNALYVIQVILASDQWGFFFLIHHLFISP